MDVDITARLWAKVAKSDNCWLWQGCVVGGYGVMSIQQRNKYVHRLAYELLVGPIPEGLAIDHVCHNRDSQCQGGKSCAHRRCVRPDHLEAVSLRTNTLRSRNTVTGANVRKDRCPKGHAFVIPDKGQRYCRECNNKSNRERKMTERRTAGVPAGRGVHERTKTHCPQGHAYDEANTRVSPEGWRVCRTCERSRRRERDRRRTRPGKR